jgi:hypothetical protein
VPGLQTEYAFTLPKGYVDGDGRLHREGIMRLATARDEIEPLRDPRINSADDPYLTILVLSRVITELGTLSGVTATVVENLFAADIAFLQDLYGIINFGNPADVAVLQQAVLPDEPAVLEDAFAPAGAELEGTGAFDDEGDAGASGDELEAAEMRPASRRRDRIQEVSAHRER